MSIDEMIINGGTLTIERYYQKGNNGYKTTFAKFVPDFCGEREYREVGTLFTTSIRKALKYMPDLIEKYAAAKGYRGFEIDLRSSEDKETRALEDFSNLLDSGYFVCLTGNNSKNNVIEANIHGVNGYLGEVKADSVEASLIDSAEFVRDFEDEFTDDHDQYRASFDEGFII